jgi:hypothetical protein
MIQLQRVYRGVRCKELLAEIDLVTVALGNIELVEVGIPVVFFFRLFPFILYLFCCFLFIIVITLRFFGGGFAGDFKAGCCSISSSSESSKSSSSSNCFLLLEEGFASAFFAAVLFGVVDLGSLSDFGAIILIRLVA